MSSIEMEMGKLSSAEEFLDFFGVEYSQAVVNVKRLHILKRFQQYLARHSFTGMTEAERKEAYRGLLAQAYHDFVTSDAVTEKVFKVFRDAAGVQTFGLEQLRASLPARG